MTFKKGDHVRLNISLIDKLFSTANYYILTGKWIWPPQTGYIIGQHPDMDAWELSYTTRNRYGTWLVTYECAHKFLEKIPKSL